MFLYRALLAAGIAVASSQCRSLRDFALDKILQDSTQLFGDYESALSSKGGTSEWMKQISDSTPLVHMNIPGTHDSGTWNFTLPLMKDIYVDNNITDPQDFQCQQKSLADMLNSGIRFFDLRPALDPTRTYLTIWHGAVEASQLASIEDLMFAFYAWLDHHPSETLLLSFQYQGGTIPGASHNKQFEQLMFDMLTSPAAKKYIWQESGRLGTLGEVRGKIVLMKRFDIEFLAASQDIEIPGLHLSPSRWTDNGANITLIYNDTTGATAYIEDNYEVGDPATNVTAADNIDIKVKASVSHLNFATNGNAPDDLFITFLSSEHLFNDPSMTPRAMALGIGNGSTPKGGVNQQVNEYLETKKGKRLGIVVADFFDEPSNLIENILSK
ncbi:hypothetical protein VHEMI09205 [[Torrubiella] hemipterigena]|uniref:Phosphatidylinositol-specific phospholipase C X domain-containing protein n=1 Tax=[Torrubiella] hemipterigena TaxID=1531966 RepID=A0A0A1TR42_9HYPO|nr:hypothetical protein VHEMI09205 [[Torrubiella] hemipterigena]